MSTFATLEQIPKDALFALAATCRADTDPNKIDLGIGAYRDNNGKPFILPAVRRAKEMLFKDPQWNHEYLPIEGLKPFTDAAARLILGSASPIIKEGRYVAVQSVSGTGALRIAAEFLSKCYRFKSSTALSHVYVSRPTWGNHFGIFRDAGFKVNEYAYYDAKRIALDLNGMLRDLNAAPEGSIIVLHACAHNPTGVDPNKDEWRQIADVMEARSHFVFFDCAYQGFASGDLDQDAWAVRYFFHERGMEGFVSQSFAKNMGLYGERCGCLTVALKTSNAVDRVSSQLAGVIRRAISNPPAFGARVADLVMNSPSLYAEWVQNMKDMSNRISSMRHALLGRLKELQTPGRWEHIVEQIGMFSYTGLSPDQCKTLVSKFHVYLTEQGRVSMAGLNEGNVLRFAEAIDWTVRNIS